MAALRESKNITLCWLSYSSACLVLAENDKTTATYRRKKSVQVLGRLEAALTAGVFRKVRWESSTLRVSEMEQALRESTDSTDSKDNRPDIRHFLQFFLGPVDIRSLALTGILILLTFYTLYFARDFFLPVILAILLSMLLTPVIRVLNRIHIPQAASAAVVLVMVLGIATYGIYRLSSPAAEWIERAPQSVSRAQSKLRRLLRPVEEMRQTTEQIEKMATLGKDANTPTVEIRKPGLSEIVLVKSQHFFAWGGVTLILLYFLLASGDLFLLKLVKVLPTLKDKKRAVEICRQIQRDISIYLSTVTLVNIALGVAVGSAMFSLGLPNPVLWGVMATLLNYVPYLGALVGITILTIVGILTLDNLTPILLVPCLYFILNVLEAYLITPALLGRKLALNPVVIFLWLVFWSWIWGAVGALLAVPSLAIIKIICDHFMPLSAVGEFLGSEPDGTSQR